MNGEKANMLDNGTVTWCTSMKEKIEIRKFKYEVVGALVP